MSALKIIFTIVREGIYMHDMISSLCVCARACVCARVCVCVYARCRKLGAHNNAGLHTSIYT